VPRVSWKWQLSAGTLPSSLARSASTLAGVAMPVVSPSETPAQPAPASRSASSTTRPGGTSPSYGQPHAVETVASTGVGAASATTPAISPMVSATDRFTLARL
jgi:hypothetical protein